MAQYLMFILAIESVTKNRIHTIVSLFNNFAKMKALSILPVMLHLLFLITQYEKFKDRQAIPR
jgi:hypothetical protein